MYQIRLFLTVLYSSDVREARRHGAVGGQRVDVVVMKRKVEGETCCRFACRMVVVVGDDDVDESQV